MSGMEPIDLILTLIPNLTDKEKQQVFNALKITYHHPCIKGGHKFKFVRHIPSSFWQGITECDKFICERCGLITYV